MASRGLADANNAAVPDHVGHRERLRTRLREGGDEAMPDYELLELVLFAAIPRQDTKPIAKRLLESCRGDFASVFSASREELKAIDGVGDAVVDQLKIVRAASARLARAVAGQSEVTLSSWKSVVDYCMARLSRESIEQFRVLYLDKKNKLVRDHLHGSGTVDHAPVYPREVMAKALELKASALILVHNHPSGDPTPSSADVDMTRQIVEAARTMEITVHDHLIVGRHGHASLRQLGLM